MGISHICGGVQAWWGVSLQLAVVQKLVEEKMNGN
jgi:hypothetical protein